MLTVVVAGVGEEGGCTETETYEIYLSPRGPEEEEEVLGHGYFGALLFRKVK